MAAAAGAGLQAGPRARMYDDAAGHIFSRCLGSSCVAWRLHGPWDGASPGGLVAGCLIVPHAVTQLHQPSCSERFLCRHAHSLSPIHTLPAADGVEQEQLVTKASLVCSQHIVNRSGVPEQACHAAATAHFERLLRRHVCPDNILASPCLRSVELFCWYQPLSTAAVLLLFVLCLSQRVMQHAAIQLARTCKCELILKSVLCLHQPACLSYSCVATSHAAQMLMPQGVQAGVDVHRGQPIT